MVNWIWWPRKPFIYVYADTLSNLYVLLLQVHWIYSCVCVGIPPLCSAKHLRRLSFDAWLSLIHFKCFSTELKPRFQCQLLLCLYVHTKSTQTPFLQILKKIIDDATKINYQLVKIIVMFFSGYDIRHILSKRSI